LDSAKIRDLRVRQGTGGQAGDSFEIYCNWLA